MKNVAPAFLLVVEDSDEDFDTVLEAARRTGVQHEIRRAASGDEGLRLMDEWERERQPLPVLVLLDLNTPGADGRDVLLALRANPRLRPLPLVVLSTSHNPRDLEFCYNNGANAFHTKPLDYPAHLILLEQIFAYWLIAAVLPERPLFVSPP